MFHVRTQPFVVSTLVVYWCAFIVIFFDPPMFLHIIKLFKQYTHNIAMTLYKINPLRFEKIPLTIKNYPWPCGSKLRFIVIPNSL